MGGNLAALFHRVLDRLYQPCLIPVANGQRNRREALKIGGGALGVAAGSDHHCVGAAATGGPQELARFGVGGGGYGAGV